MSLGLKLYVINAMILTSSILTYTSTINAELRDKTSKDSEIVNYSQTDLEAGLEIIDDFIGGKYKSGTTIAGKKVGLHEATVGKYNIQKLADKQEIESYLAVFDQTLDNWRGFVDIEGFRVYFDLGRFPKPDRSTNIINAVYSMKANQENQRKMSEGILTVVTENNIEKLESLVNDAVEAIGNR